MFEINCEETNYYQGCSLAAPGGPWLLSFAPGRLVLKSQFLPYIINWAPWISKAQSIGLPTIIIFPLSAALSILSLF